MIDGSFSWRRGVLLAGLGLAGCQSADPRRDSIEAPVARMPIVNLPERPPPDVVTFEAIMRAAQARDLPAMVTATLRLEEPAERAQTAARVALAIAGHDLDFATQFATALPAGNARERSLVDLAQALAQRREVDPLAWALHIADGSASLIARRAAIEQLVRADAPAALARVMALPNDRGREDLLGLAVAAWARQDATAAIDWVRALPAGPRKDRLIATATFEIAQADPRRALALAETLPTGRDRALLFSTIGQTWVARDPKAAMAWANQLPAGDSRDAAFAGIDTGLGVPARRRVASMPASAGGRTRGALGGGGNWPEMASPDFAAWVSTQPPGMSRDEAILEYVRQRGVVQPAAIGPWLASLPASPVRDQAMEIFVDGLMISSPGEAARWITALPRAGRRDEMIERAARRWLLTNPAAAEAWLRDTPLPPDRREQLLREAGL